MSNIYSTEPRTTGIVNLNTTYGPLRIELWGKECPLACRNFIQLCLEGYYDQSLFHRLVPGFCLQGGKPANCPEGDKEGSSIFPGGRFAVETHSRLNFNRRGLLGMVASNPNLPKSSSNGSQFFFTLSEAPELNGRATIFGRLVNDTVFNLLRMAELEIDPNTEAPLYPSKIINTEVILNPFNDIIPREKPTAPNELREQHNKPIRSQFNINKSNRALLSFVDDVLDSNDPETRHTRTTPSYYVPQPSPQTTLPPASSSTSSSQFLQHMKAVQMRDTQDKIKKMEEELGFRTVENKPKDFSVGQKEAKKNVPALEKYKMKFQEIKRRKDEIEKPKDEIDTLLLLNSFRQKIQKTGNSSEKIQNSSDAEFSSKKHLDICKLHGLLDCLSCRDTYNISLKAATETDKITEKDWILHKLVFDRRESDGQVREDLKNLVVIDPKEQQKNNPKSDK